MMSILTMPRFITVNPPASLRKVVSHYWLSLDNADSAYSAMPDGAVDLVIGTRGSTVQSWIYGTTTTRTEISLEKHGHYLGVRFKPGQSRHFINAAANELTDGHELSDQLVRFPLSEILENGTNEDVFARLNRTLETYLTEQSPARASIDDIISLIETSRGAIDINEAAAAFDKGRRQFERVFLQTVGVSAKCFASINRFHHAASLVAQRRSTLVDIAAQAGYADQSHMTHEFRRLARISPAAFARQHVVFIQDSSLTTPDNTHS